MADLYPTFWGRKTPGQRLCNEEYPCKFLLKILLLLSAA
ncbi:hypothetical protein SAMN04490183_2628 [Pseudomonas corrugata]|nr:hypothetical protein SAMN04490183_2628 [Pseudomonas corrugata]